MQRKLMLFLILTVLFVNVLAVSAFAETAPAITVKSVAAESGASVEVPIMLENCGGFASLGIEISYDETALKLTNVTPNSSTGATFTKAQSYDAKPYNMSWDSASNSMFNGTLVTLTFEVITNTEGVYPISVDYYKGRDGSYADGENINYDENFEPLGLSYTGGAVTVKKLVIDPAKPTDTPDPIETPTPTQAPNENENYPKVRVENIKSKSGASVDVPIMLENCGGFASLGIEISYDETALKLTNVTPNSSTGATFTKAQSYDAKPYNMSWDSASNSMFNGTLVTLTFDVITNTEGVYPISVDYYKGRDGSYADGENINYDENFEPLGLSYIGGAVTVKNKEFKAPYTYDIDNAEISGNTLTADIDYDGTDGESKAEAILIKAMYSSDNILENVEFEKLNGSAKLNASCNVSDGGKVKLYIWDGINTLKPLCETIELEK